jgi:phage recombination protein Bet
MAQAAQRQAVTIAPRYTKPANFAGTDSSWRALCECYPNAETPDVVMAVVEYCAVRRLDPYKRPVHVVPMYNARLRRKVQVVMQGINEVQITAARTGQWAGEDLPQWGPPIEHTFRGQFENDDGSTRAVEVRMSFPEWCAVTVHRLVGGEPRRFTEQLWWLECYARAGFRSEVPNARWQQAPRQMLHKCTKAAVLRAAFPEEASFTAEEMEDRETDAGGIVIDGTVTQPEAPSEADRRADDAYGTRPPPGEADTLADLGRLNGDAWLRAVEVQLTTASNLDAVHAVATHRTVKEALAEAPTLIRARINDLLRAAHERLAPAGETDGEDPPPDADADDPIGELLAEVEAMDLDAIETLHGNMAWGVKTRDLFPLDADRLRDAIDTRKAVLRSNRRKEQ